MPLLTGTSVWRSTIIISTPLRVISWNDIINIDHWLWNSFSLLIHRAKVLFNISYSYNIPPGWTVLSFNYIDYNERNVYTELLSLLWCRNSQSCRTLFDKSSKLKLNCIQGAGQEWWNMSKCLTVGSMFPHTYLFPYDIPFHFTWILV